MSRERLLEHRRIWAGKPVLRRVYAPWFASLLDGIPRGARVLEIGAGPGLLAEAARRERPDLRWLASDLHAASWNTLAADAGALPLATGSVQAVLGLDVLHHLPDPEAFFGEAARVLDEHGDLALIEPWISPFSWPLYRFFHQEDCRLSVDPWRPFPPGKDSFDGDAAVPWKLVRSTPQAHWNRLGFEAPRLRPMNAFAYVLSLGFRDASLLPEAAAGGLMALDRWTAPLARLTALRATIRWRKTQAAT